MTRSADKTGEKSGESATSRHSDEQRSCVQTCGSKNAAAQGLDTFRIKSVCATIECRKRRRLFFNSALFADPAWDILLALYMQALKQEKVSILNLSALAEIPNTTTLRWIEKLHSENLISRQRDPLDARRVWIRLSNFGINAMEKYFDALQPAL